MTGPIHLWLHLLAFAAYFGASASVLIFCLPMATAEAEPKRTHGILASTMRVYDPFAIAALALLMFTGALNVNAYGPAADHLFYQRLAGPLGWKLLLTFLLFNLTIYVVFAIGHRLVRYFDAEEPLSPERLRGMITHLRISLLLALGLVGGALWAALAVGRSTI